ncbi:MAG: SsrA-binding protein [Candidatus Omnitrophica bacterium CG11_big_fil_rev_8_21_14_0_20_45_26]|uniref:SsrA-binding protein n=1 Tax=Candidatus Abzuiibacterium crystallinum TaxID=1974748 RepID=A0A2H0LQU5_9BACT|nr:MAG: SsrA-binding protein [Candidatus Omnitrophica bacterium CG11_big_fil_rev_8_21_14_0_20_45_26]PIW64643.1 MAG: SsrA-binding protein [Candidatus Omnitrophica bacterium CG12_big_fil_rev_8_21_14_0_65_45_16]
MTTQAITDNRKARHDYFLFDKYEAGLELKGSEVKAIRDGHCNLRDAFVRIARGEAFLINMHISPYRYTHDFVPEALRTRKLLLKKREIAKLYGQISQKGYACVPLRLYFKRNLVKVEIAVATKKKAYDKRETIKREIHKRETDRAMKQRLR